MSQYQPYGPKKLQRNRTDKYIGGVCGGVAAYLNMDPTLVRILTVVLTLITGVPVVAYIVALFLMPEEPISPAGYVASPTAAPADDVWGPAGPPWSTSEPTEAPKRDA